MRTLERRIDRLERRLVIRRLLMRYRQVQRDLQVLEMRRRQAEKQQAKRAPVQPAAPRPAAPSPPPVEPAAVALPSPPLAGMVDPAIEAPAPPPAEPAFDLAEHMQIRPIRWVPVGERYTAEPHQPEDEDYDPFAEFDDDQ
jgi:hypothetical protein